MIIARLSMSPRDDSVALTIIKETKVHYSPNKLEIKNDLKGLETREWRPSETYATFIMLHGHTKPLGTASWRLTY